MSVLIKGITLEQFYRDLNNVRDMDVDWDIVQLPPHGRLIDADAAAKQGWTISRTYSATPTEMVYEVKTMTDEVLPTIIQEDVTDTNDGKMTEYIKREDVMERVGRWQLNTREAIAEMIMSVPSADVIERKRGEWYDRGSLSCRCSNCGCKANKEYSFCPNCGADMRGRKDG